jgi:hypothetical protein
MCNTFQEGLRLEEARLEGNKMFKVPGSRAAKVKVSKSGCRVDTIISVPYKPFFVKSFLKNILSNR